ncbi:LysR family transcriptional regulator [Terrisporobacter vanillatitrophus]|uniref:LysR family transcriptional regulator n=1 Tax=Terrisporobacter vanillatitrophus TaxID=3058402 RepID=UPI00336966BF
MDMNIQKFMAFVITVEKGSFSKAAQILNYSQSGISRMINDLEKQWGVSLLLRDRSGVRLTSDGYKLFPLAKNICEDYEKLQNKVEELNNLESGLIRIGTFSSVATHWLPNIIKAFKKDYPNIDYELLLGDYNEIENWIIEGRVDCGFISLPTHNEFDTIFLEEDKFLAVLPENHPLASLDFFPIESICDYPFMLLEKGVNTEVSDLLHKHNISPNVYFTTWDDYSIMSMVESNLGISILPKLILQRIPYKIVTKELDVPAFRKIGVALKDMKNSSLAVKKFLEYLDCRKI